MTNQQVLDAWLAGREAQSNNLQTNGRELYSYDLVIARYGWSDDQPIVYNYRSKGGGHFMSNTTSKHVTTAIGAVVNAELIPIITHPPEIYNDGRRTT